MRRTCSAQIELFSKSLIFLMMAFLCWGSSVSRANYLSDTFSDDTLGDPPNGPEIGSATYGGTGTSHTVINRGGGDLGLRSVDSSTGGGILISYRPIASSDLLLTEYLISIRSGSNLVARNAFLQELILRPTGANIMLHWGDDKRFYVVITRPGKPNETISTGMGWSFDTDYQVNWVVDMANDQFSLSINGTPVLVNKPMLLDLTSLYGLSFASNFDTTGSQVIDNVLISRVCQGPCIWYVDASASGSNNGTNWTDAFRYLQDALAAAQACDEVRVATGTYRPDRGGGQSPGDRQATFQLISGVAIKGGYAGSGEPDPNVRNIEVYEAVLSGDIGAVGNNSDNSLHVVTSSSNDSTAILDGFTITAGHAEGSYPDYIGGGMYIPNGSPTVSNCLFSNNSSGCGGGLAIRGSGSPTLTNCIFVNNTAGAAVGGGVEIQQSSPTLLRCIFLGNTADGGGGGMRIMNNSDYPKLTNCVFSGNSTLGEGAALRNSGVGGTPNPHPPVLTNCTFSENSAGVAGGGLYNTGGNDATIDSCIFWANTAAGAADESAQIQTSGLAPVIDYSCVQGWTGSLGGTGNIGEDPCFVDADGPDDIAGTEDDNVRLSFDSPCIDAGHPGPEYQDPDGTRNDMGAYGGPYGPLSSVGTHAGSGFVFTSIGNIPTSEITRDGNSLSHGLVNVADANVAKNLGIPYYKDSPLGAKIWIHGLFGDTDDVDYYRILAARWVDGSEPEPNDFAPLTDPLTKVEYYVDPCTDNWTYRYVNLGPKLVAGMDKLYQLTYEGYWSHIDLRVRWNTRAYLNGKYTLTYEAFRWADPCQTTLIDANLPSTGWDDLTVIVDNNPVTAIIHSVKYDPCSPYYYDPCDGEIPECAIINLTDANENLRFTVTASHPTGYLRRYILDALYGKNKYAGIIAADSYTPVSPPHWYGVEETEFQSQDSASLDSWRQCAYQFRLRSYSRATNGYHYIISREFNDHYFLDLGVAGCCRGDLDQSGEVNFKDLAIFAAHWLESYEP